MTISELTCQWCGYRDVASDSWHHWRHWMGGKGIDVYVCCRLCKYHLLLHLAREYEVVDADVWLTHRRLRFLYATIEQERLERILATYRERPQAERCLASVYRFLAQEVPPPRPRRFLVLNMGARGTGHLLRTTVYLLPDRVQEFTYCGRVVDHPRGEAPAGAVVVAGELPVGYPMCRTCAQALRATQ